jgi:hypothetical protein
LVLFSFLHKHFYDAPINETKGQHTAIISRELYDTVQAVKDHRSNGKSHARKHEYVLQGLVYCWRCFNRRYLVVGDNKNFGKTNCITTPTTARLIADGPNFKLSDAPGLGIDVNEELAASLSYQPSEPPHLPRHDGSFTNW